MDVKGLLADHFGQFAAKDVANLLVAVAAAALLATLVAAWGARKGRGDARRLALWAALFAAGVGLVRTQLPLSLALVALALLLRPSEASARDQLALGAVLIIGLACGSGATIVALVLSVLLTLLLRWAGQGGDQATGR